LGAVTVRESALYASNGSILSAAGTAFPATSTYDTFLEIATPSATYFNRNRLRLGATIEAIPPTGDSYTGDDITLYRDGMMEGTIAGRVVGITMNVGGTFVALPPAGTDCLDSEIHLQMTVNGTGLEHVIGLGPVMLTRGAPVDPGDGRTEVPLEIVSMNLGGTGQVLGEFHVVEVPAQASSGLAKSVSPGVSYPVDVNIDARVEIQLPTLGRTLVPQVPPHLHAIWNTLPEIGIAIDGNNQPTTVVDKVTGMPAGTIDFFYIVHDSVCTYAPPATVELFDATGSATIELFGAGTATIVLGGNGTLVRGPGRDAGGGTIRTDTELRALTLSGSGAPIGSIVLQEDGNLASNGHVTGTIVGSLLPASAGFGAFIAVQSVNGLLRPTSAVALNATAPVTTLPFPAGTQWALAGGPVDLRNSSGITRGRLIAWTLVTGAPTPWPTDVGPPGGVPGGDALLDAVLAAATLERNPTRGAARFTVPLDRARQVALQVFDARGARVRTVARAALAPGTHVLEWDGRDDAGRDAGAGLYFYRIEIDGRSRGGKLVRLR
jgi:hypothetical protein